MGAEAPDEAVIEQLLPAPKPGMGPEAGFAPKQPCLSAGADGEPKELEGPALGTPGLRRLPTADLLKIAGQWLSGTNGPDAGGGVPCLESPRSPRWRPSGGGQGSARWARVSTRPFLSQANPLSASQLGASLPVHSRVLAVSGAALSLSLMCD